MYQNNLLQQAILELNQENPNAVIVYADYYNAYLSIFRNGALLGEKFTAIFIYFSLH